MPNLLIEEDFGWPYKSIAGVDEAGRGPIAGPVVAAAVIFNKEYILRTYKSCLLYTSDAADEP